MTNSINFKKEVTTNFDATIERVTAVLSEVGFGVLTRIDLHQKIKEKIDKEIPKVVILGACNPSFAYQAYLKCTDVTSLLPCNAVIREIGDGKVCVELAKPSTLMKLLGDTELERLAMEADERLERALKAL